MWFYVSASSFLMNSPTSAWWNTTMDMGSTRRQSCVDFAATPNPCEKKTYWKKLHKKDFFFPCNRVAVAILCKNTTRRCSNNKTPHFSGSEINTGSELMSSSADPTTSWLRETHQGHIRHGVDHHSLVLHCVLGDPPEAWFQYVVPVEEGLFCSRLHPHLKLNNIQTCFNRWCRPQFCFRVNTLASKNRNDAPNA